MELWQAVQVAADEQHDLDHDHPIGVSAVLNVDPQWDYQRNAEGPLNRQL